MATKGELYDFLAAHHCQTFIDAANPYLTAMAAERHLDDTMTYSADAASHADVMGRVVSSAPFLCFEWTHGATYRVQTHLIGTCWQPSPSDSASA